MNIKGYSYFATSDYKDYSFYSNGPKGRIKKLVVYEKINDEPLVFNLAFGDEDPETGVMLDRLKSSNNDRDAILATVARTIGDFSDHYGKPMIHIVGSSNVRTRLYQISISKIHDEICTEYLIQGYREGAWEYFQKNVNYEAFVVQKN